MTVKLLHQIGDRSNGPNFNTLEEILECKEPLHFDGVYESVWQNFRELKGKDVTFFVSGDYVGKTNAFDVGQPLSTFCNMAKVEEMAHYLDARIGWHGKRHINCAKVVPQLLQEELELPEWWGNYTRTRPILAWPYGDFDKTAIQVAQRLGFMEAWSVRQGDDSEFAKKREHLNW